MMMSNRRLLSVLPVLLFLLFGTVSLQAADQLSWGRWRKLPVFDGGRVMPLDTFAQQIVEEICGTSRPFICVDDMLLTELEKISSDFPLPGQEQANVPDIANTYRLEAIDSLLGKPTLGVENLQLRDETAEAEPRQEPTLSYQEAQRILQRIRFLIPNRGGRYFEAHEILLSWLVEPEVWEYLPFLPANDLTFRQELGVLQRNQAGYRLRYVAISQVAGSMRYQQHRARIQESLENPRHGQTLSETERQILALEQATSAYQALTFRPTRDFPEVSLHLLQGTWERRENRIVSLELLPTALDGILQLTGSRELTGSAAAIDLLQETMQIAHMLPARYSPRDEDGRALSPNIVAIEQEFETLMTKADRLLALSVMLMNRLYPEADYPLPPGVAPYDGGDFSELFAPEILERHLPVMRQHFLQLHYAATAFRREVQAAYLALYDNGRSLRILPVLFDAPLLAERDNAIPQQPWISIQTFLYAGDPMMRRFVDPEFKLEPAAETESSPETVPVVENSRIADDGIENIELTEASGEEPAVPALSPPGQQTLIADLAAMTRPVTNSTERARIAFADLAEAYMQTGHDPQVDQPFSAALDKLEQSLLETAERLHPVRIKLVPATPANLQILAKTDYPPRNGTAMEYRYARLAPFFWMWVLSAVSTVLVLCAMLISMMRREQLGESDLMHGVRTGKIPVENPLRRWGVDAFLFWCAVVFLLLSVLMTFLGGAMRAWITGWAPITNMFETVVLMGFVAGLFGLWYTLNPLLGPILRRSWQRTAFPNPATGIAMLRDFMAKKKGDDELDDMYPPEMQPPAATSSTGNEMLFWNSLLALPRILLMLPVFMLTLRFSYVEYMHEWNLFGTVMQVFSVQDPIDRFVVLGCIIAITWFVPRLLLTILVAPMVLLRTDLLAAEAGITLPEEEQPEVYQDRSLQQIAEAEERAASGLRDNVTGRMWLADVKRQITERKLFVLVGAFVMLLAGLAASYHSEFNPNIRPLMAVLRSNFWLAAHVTAIIISYSAASISWALATIATGYYIFGTYERDMKNPEAPVLHAPPICARLAPYILQMLRLSVLLLCIGTILGARWADYSWGRFWGWDPKEVWALITICFFLIVLHGRLGRFYGTFGLIIGGALGSIPVLLTWYGVSFVFRSGLHAYGGIEKSSGPTFMMIFIALNVCWCFAAIFRYQAEKYGSNTEEEAA